MLVGLRDDAPQCALHSRTLAATAASRQLGNELADAYRRRSAGAVYRGACLVVSDVAETVAAAASGCQLDGRIVGEPCACNHFWSHRVRRRRAVARRRGAVGIHGGRRRVVCCARRRVLDALCRAALGEPLAEPSRTCPPNTTYLWPRVLALPTRQGQCKGK